MKLLPENPTQFDYLHAIRAVASRIPADFRDVGLVKQILDLANDGMNLATANPAPRPPDFESLSGDQIDTIMDEQGYGYTGSLDTTAQYRRFLPTVGEVIQYTKYLFYILEPNQSLWEAACSNDMNHKMYVLATVVDAPAAARTEAFGHLRGLWVSAKIEKWELKHRQR